MKSFLHSLKIFIHEIGVLIQTPSSHYPPHCCNINALLLHLCDFDRGLHAWVLRWIAYPLRHPGAKMQTGLVFNGGHSTGKTLFFEDVVAALYRGSGIAVFSSQFCDETASWPVRARFVAVDAGGYHRGVAARLRQLVTRTSIVIHDRFHGSCQIPNQLNLVVLASGTDFLPVTAADEHVIVIEAPPPQAPAFYSAVAHEIAHGGIEEFRRYLVEDLDMRGFHEGTLPPEQRVQQVALIAA